MHRSAAVLFALAVSQACLAQVATLTYEANLAESICPSCPTGTLVVWIDRSVPPVFTDPVTAEWSDALGNPAVLGAVWHEPSVVDAFDGDVKVFDVSNAVVRMQDGLDVNGFFLDGFSIQFTDPMPGLTSASASLSAVNFTNPPTFADSFSLAFPDGPLNMSGNANRMISMSSGGSPISGDFSFIAVASTTAPPPVPACSDADVTTTGATIEGQPGYARADGEVDLDDLGYFLNLWLAGCP